MPHIKVDEIEKSDVRRDYLRFWSEITPSIVFAVEQSFRAGASPSRHPTQTEAKRRTVMAKELVRVMRYELRWSKFRIRDVLAQALQHKLIGLEIDLEALGRRSSW